MQIQSIISNLNHIQRNNTYNNVINKRINNDSFVKTISFGKSERENNSQSFEKFQDWANKNGFIEKAKDIANKPENVLGYGFEGIVYAIPDTQEWVMKEYKRSNYIATNGEESRIVETEDISPELNIGQEIARAEIKVNSHYADLFHILKRQSGQSYGVPLSISNFVGTNTKNAHLKSLKMLSEASQSTFDKCVQDVKYITNIGYEIDYGNTENFLFDKVKQQINFVDIADRLTRQTSQQAEVLYALLDGNFASTFNSSTQPTNEEKEEARQYSNTIFEKYTKAMEKAGVDFSKNEVLDEVYTLI